MTPRLVADYWPNGPTFAMPTNWSDAVLSEGSNSVSMPNANAGFLGKEKDEADAPDAAVTKR